MIDVCGSRVSQREGRLHDTSAGLHFLGEVAGALQLQLKVVQRYLNKDSISKIPHTLNIYSHRFDISVLNVEVEKALCSKAVTVNA